jgi:hypothetical protein
MSQHFYDGQVRRYITQLVRMFSNYSYKDGKGAETVIPVLYGDLTRQVANIIKGNSENKIPSAPRMALYISGLALDRDRTADQSYVSKVNVREKAYDNSGQEYLNFEGKNYTVERLMPTPYMLTVNLDIWSTNTDQKLQILEQILMLFNPSLELQTTDNYIDWTSLSVVTLDNVNFSSRAIPVGIDDQIDVATLTFTTPIWISPPVKVKRLGVIANIITSIFDESQGTVELGLSAPLINAFDDSAVPGTSDKNKSRGISTTATPHVVTTNYQGYDLFVNGTVVELSDKGKIGQTSWKNIIDTHPGQYQAGISRIYLTKIDTSSSITGTFAVNELDDTQIVVNWDTDSFPANTIISSPDRSNSSLTSVDYIIDPTKTFPASKTQGTRVLLLGPIGATGNTDGADAWKNLDNSDVVASENDIIEWSGSAWSVIFDASATVNNTTVTYITNLNTGVQYRWNGEEWLLSVEGLYPQGTWRVALNG